MTRPDYVSALVEECPFPAGIVDLDALRYVAANEPVAEMFGVDAPPVGEHVLQFVVDPDDTAERLRLLRGNKIHWFETVWQIRAANGSSFPRRGWAVSLVGEPDYVFVVAGPGGPVRPAIDVLRPPASDLTVAMVSDRWVIENVSAGIVDLVGWRADQWQGRPLLGEIHPADVAAFSNAVLQAARSDGGVSVEARLRDASTSWRAVTLGVITTPSDSDLPAIVLTLSPSLATWFTSGQEEWRRWATLSDGLEAAAATIRDLLADRMPAVELSERQVEIVTRLLSGERIPTAAAAMNLSQSTLRSHLAVVFQKFGVNSQEELLRSVRRTLDGPSSNIDRRRPFGGSSN